MSNISRSTISIRIFGDELDPEYITQLLGYKPTSAAKTGDRITKPNGEERIVKRGFWRLEYGEFDDLVLEEKINLLLAKLTNDLDAWKEATKNIDMADIFCGLFIDELNEGFSLSPSIMRKISDRNLAVDFDIYSPTSSWPEEIEESETTTA